ncbi:hypothetical protein [Luteimonas deserti]|uniref:Uncharacterized protein n=1 Tax=Luteimonas deserti TaxID=2752306 RepID=A0A7Z0QQQ1_9GAMM|nr:hypothetical protein [Luteimonas deserti]NYZ62953.1 hypothetical protein [Luteimonas deserti]
MASSGFRISVFIVAAVLASWAYLHGRDAREAQPIAEGAPVAQAPDALGDVESSPLWSLRNGTGAGETNATLAPFSRVPASRFGMPLATDPFEAESIEEQRWLDRNGFPNEAQLREYSTASDGLLRVAAERGDRLARVELDGRLLMQGDHEAVDRLLASAEQGSLYALTKLASYAAVSPDGSPALAYSISRVQEIRGDTRIALARNLLMARPLEPMEEAEAELDALRMARDLEARFKGGNFRDPRPWPPLKGAPR